MRIELVLSNTYVCQGKVYNKVDAQGSRLTYQVSASVGRYLLDQHNERGLAYFRQAGTGGPAVAPATKSIDKGGKPQPVEEEVADTAGADERAAEATQDDWKALQKKGKALGIYEQGMTKDALIDAIEKVEAADAEADDDNDDAGDGITV